VQCRRETDNSPVQRDDPRKKIVVPEAATERAEALALVRETARTQHKSGNYPKVRRTRAA